MKLAVIGSRGFNDFERLEKELDQLAISEIISGGAKGADSLARKYAEMRGIPIVEHLPQYNEFGRGAPLVRNKLIIQDCDQVIAFHDGKSRGTLHSISLAEKAQKPVKTVIF